MCRSRREDRRQAPIQTSVLRQPQRQPQPQTSATPRVYHERQRALSIPSYQTFTSFRSCYDTYRECSIASGSRLTSPSPAMEPYPRPYVEHNLPLVLLSGLGQEDDEEQGGEPRRRAESGARILTASPECDGERCQQLLTEFKAWDGTGQAWNATALPGPTGSIRYCLKTIGRVSSRPKIQLASVDTNMQYYSSHVPCRPGKQHLSRNHLAEAGVLSAILSCTPLSLHCRQDRPFSRMVFSRLSGSQSINGRFRRSFWPASKSTMANQARRTSS